MRALGVVALVVGMLLLGTGCLEAPFALGPAQQAKVDRAYVGDFGRTGSDGKVESLVIRNIDDHQYYVECAREGESDRMRMTGWLTTIGPATFASLREMKPDGVLSNPFLIVRVSLSADQSSLEVRGLSEDFFKQKNTTSPEQLRKLIGEHVDDASMYDPNDVRQYARAVGEPSK